MRPDWRCDGCNYWEKGERDDNGRIFFPTPMERTRPGEKPKGPPPMTGYCCIRSVPENHFPKRYADERCGEFKKAEAVKGYDQIRHLTTG